MRLIPLTFIVIAGAAQAQDSSAPAGPTSEQQGARVIDCYCTDTSGARVDLGETICLMVDGRAFLARCEMSLNNPMWRDTGAACVGAAVSLPSRGAPQSEAAVF